MRDLEKKARRILTFMRSFEVGINMAKVIYEWLPDDKLTVEECKAISKDVMYPLDDLMMWFGGAIRFKVDVSSKPVEVTLGSDPWIMDGHGIDPNPVINKSAEVSIAPLRIVCAAIRYEDIIICGSRHWDTGMRVIMDCLRSKHKPEYRSRWEQGFIDQTGAFHDRKEAYKIAKAANQVNDTRNGSETELYSEGLY